MVMDGWAGSAVGENVDQRHRGGSQKSNPSNEMGVEDRRIEGMIVIGTPIPPPPPPPPPTPPPPPHMPSLTSSLWPSLRGRLRNVFGAKSGQFSLH